MAATEPKPTTVIAPPTKARHSVARMTDYWYVVCESRELKARKPLAVTLWGTPLVVFRTHSGVAGALLDRCPHRNVPLSKGAVRGDCLECCYHGWQFDTTGACRKVPGLVDGGDHHGRGATSYAVREQQGYVWVYANPSHEPTTGPYHIPHLDDRRYTHAYRQAEAEGTLHATIENALDVPHTSFLHRGLFRGTGKRNDITAVVKRWADRCEAEYVGEPAPRGVAARVLSPNGGTVVHFDRFALPSIAVVDYALGNDTHVYVTSCCTPVSEFHTRLFATVSFRLGRIPGWLIKPLLEPLGRWIFSQDAKILKLQTETIERFGGEQYVSTEIDVLGPHIWRLMKAAERGDAAPSDEAPYEKTLQLNV